MGAGVGAVSDIALQLALNGGNFDCLDWGDVGVAAGLGALGGAAGGLLKGARYGRMASTQISISEGKLGYVLGKASGRAHNVARAHQNAGQLARVGVYDNSAGRQLLRDHLRSVAADPSNVSRTFVDQYGKSVVKESLFAGPGGFLKFESAWQVTSGGRLRLTSVIPFGG